MTGAEQAGSKKETQPAVASMQLDFPMFLVPCLAILACGDPGAPELPAFTTDAQEYTLSATSIGFEGDIGFVFTNPNNSPAYIVNCGGTTALRLEKLSEGGWVTAWAPFSLDCLSAPIVVPGHAQFRGVVRVVDCSSRTNCLPRFTVSEIPGRYRIVWDEVLSSYDDRRRPFGNPLPIQQRTSNSFTISVASP